MAAGLVRLSAWRPDVGYNLAVATFFALSAVAAFALAGRCGRPRARRSALWGRSALCVVARCIVLGNLAGAASWLDDGRAAARLRLVRRRRA